MYASENIYNISNSTIYFSKDQAIATFIFDEYGVASVQILSGEGVWANGSYLKGLPYGNYYAKETVVPEGYTKDENIYNYPLNASNVSVSGNVTNTVQKAKFEVIKISSITNEIAKTIEGAEFTAILTKYVDYYGSFDEALKHLSEYAEDEYSVFTTDSNGHGTSGYLAYGNYTINETVTPEGVNKVKEFYVTIDKDSTEAVKELVANDTPFESYIKLIKRDKTTGKDITYSNATFGLYKLNEETNEWEGVSCKVGNKTYSTWTTNDEGYAVTENKLEAGTYKVTEIVVPDGYIRAEEEIIFEVSNKNGTLEYDDDYDAWISVIIENEQPTGSIELTKYLNISKSADATFIEPATLDYTKIYFKLVASEDIIDYADGSLIFEKGEVIGTYNLDEQGGLIIEGLPLGSYYIQEISTIDGFVLDDTKHEFAVEQEDTETKEYILNLEIDNFATLVEFCKTDNEGNELEGATLQLLDTDGNVIDEWVTGKETYKIEGLSVGKAYILHEKEAAPGYTIADDIEFVVENSNEIQKITMIDEKEIKATEPEEKKIEKIVQTGNEADLVSLINSLLVACAGLAAGVAELKKK